MAQSQPIPARHRRRQLAPGSLRHVDSLTAWLHQHFVYVLGGAIVLLGVKEIALSLVARAPVWDPLFDSGILTFVVGLRLAQPFPRTVDHALVRLVRCGSLPITPERLEQLQHDLEVKADRWAARAGLVVALLNLAGYVIVLPLAYVAAFVAAVRALLPQGLDPQLWAHVLRGFWVQSLLLLLASTCIQVYGGYLVGRVFGRAIAYGRLRALLTAEQVEVVAQPGHLDGAAGLSPLGDLFFGQAMLVAIPALFLAVWLVIIGTVPAAAQRYGGWKDIYLGFLAVMVAVECGAFLAPIWSFHSGMRLRKAIYMQEADLLSQRVAQLQTSLLEAQPGVDVSANKNQLPSMVDRYTAIQQMPTWPVAPNTRRWFTINNVALLLPLISAVFHLSTFWNQVLTALAHLLGGLP